MILPGIEDRRLPVILGSLPTARECHHDQKEENQFLHGLNPQELPDGLFPGYQVQPQGSPSCAALKQ